MRILFVARRFANFRNYDAPLRDLAARGHDIHFAVERGEATAGLEAVKSLAHEYPSVTYGVVRDRTTDKWAFLSHRLRLGLDYLRFIDPSYDDAPLLRTRAHGRTPRALLMLAEAPIPGRRVWRGLLRTLLDRLDRAIPVPEVLVDYVRDQRPDVLVITPLVELGSPQIDTVRAAHQLGVPTALAVWSWDNLSSKAYIRECPERLFVWNATQRDEAVRFHGVPPDRITVTGAQCFDHWFDRRPSGTREAFCGALGLPADRPLILYVCSSLILGSPPEPPFVHEWLQRLRASQDPLVASAAVLVRPHPSRMAGWRDVDLSQFGPVAVWGGNPVDEQSRAAYFDSLYHSAAVVGLNTSAFIEAGIVGREVLAILPPRFRDNQEGTLHFRYLLEIGGGLIRVSREFDTHLTQLSAALARPGSATHPHLAFLEAFVRPRGLPHAATPEFVRAVEDLAHCRVEPRRQGIHHVLLRRAVLAGLVEMVQQPDAEAWVLGPVELERRARARAAAGMGRGVRPAKRARTDDHASRLARHREEKSRRREAQKETARASRTHEKEARQAARAREKEARLAAKRASLAQRRQRLNTERAAAQDPDGSSS
jgi:hypothetical protein